MSTIQWRNILQQQIIGIYLIITFLATCSFCLGIPCQSGNWWDSVQDKCIKCTKCEDQLIVLRPCQLHQDTICGTIQDLEVDWMLLTQTEPYWRDRRKEINSTEVDMTLDWQSIALILAVSACLLLFLVAAYISIQHMRQWRRMEQRLNRDVEELSAKLMSRLADVRNIESGRFLIENPIRGQNTRPVEVRCVFLDQMSSSTKEPIKSLAKGNLYIEEAGSKG